MSGQATPPPLEYARPIRRRSRRWLTAHVGASYMSFCGVAAVHVVAALHVTGHFPSPRAYADPASVLFVAGAPLSVPFTIIVAPFVAVVRGEPPTPSYFAMVATYAAALVLIVRLTKALNSRAG